MHFNYNDRLYLILNVTVDASEKIIQRCKANASSIIEVRSSVTLSNN